MSFPCFKPSITLRTEPQLLIHARSGFYNLGPAYLSPYHLPLNMPSSILPQSQGS